MRDNKRKNPVIHYLPVFGCFSTGVIYASIGLIAILSFLKIKNGGADESSFLAFLSEYLWGKILVAFILFGTVSYIIWRFYEAYADPYAYGKETSGMLKRAGIALSTVADVLIVYAAIRYLAGKGIREEQQLAEQQQLVQDILNESWGAAAVICIGIIVALTAVVQFIYGITRGYKERLEVEEFKSFTKKLVHFTGIAGYFSRGVILAIIAYSYIKAGIINQSQMVVNTDKAFDFIGDNIGHLYFILIALGTICYGIFMFALGVAYDIDKD